MEEQLLTYIVLITEQYLMHYQISQTNVLVFLILLLKMTMAVNIQVKFIFQDQLL